ncbi:Inositol 2-dehydrogenase [Lentibacillus sp. JNUCC-1]|uniref:Gfo/Idh/MocA family protein n=1 Tax=Lentibacillus sp. JNUCC-1 TaxID=2654513 RepID=UPI0012E95E13|nr:Gfo/Idh/MocA family oxidoreductase [Lentibacillus sp. JNUCC-1]MUV37260.1 Inositol 2-dehydrogenase [Lentibacillus sp. JNUCC-1]
MKIGFISFAHMHAYAYADIVTRHSEAELAAVWDADSERGRAVSEQYGAPYFEELSDMLKTDLDAVIVCSENANHKEHVLQAAAHKKHILCEKPIATEIADAKEMIQVCDDHGVSLQIAYPVRFIPAIREAKNLIQAGKVGDVIAVNATNHGQMPGGWFVEKDLSGGGSATDHIVHLMDVLRWMFNDEAKRVHAEFDTRFYNIDVEDCGSVMLEMDSGMIVSIDPSWSRPKTYPTWGNVTMKFIGTEGTLYVDAFKQHSLYYNDKDSNIAEQPWADDMNEQLVNDFINCVQTGRKPFITGEDGLRTLEVVKGAYASDRTKQSVEIHRS